MMWGLVDDLCEACSTLIRSRRIKNLHLPNRIPLINSNITVRFAITQITITRDNQKFYLVRHRLDHVYDCSKRTARFIAGQVVLHEENDTKTIYLLSPF